MKKPFSKAVLFSGGGTRFAIYLGMLDALEENNWKPDLIIGSCGGAFSSVLINAFSNSEDRKNYLKSEEFYHFVTHILLTKHQHLKDIGWFSLKKKFNKKNAPFIENVFDRYLAEMPQNLGKYLPSLQNAGFSKEISTVIIGSKMLFEKSEVDEKRNDRKLYQKILLTDNNTAEKIDVNSIKINSENYINSAVSEEISLRTEFSMLDASRISISDMFYVAPFSKDDENFAGGAIDLVPIELAEFLAEEVCIEKKQSYKPTEEALIRAVLGCSGNARLKEIENFKHSLLIETQNISKDLDGFYNKKFINWKNFKIEMTFPESLKKHQQDIEKQWKYGYDQTIKAMLKREI